MPSQEAGMGALIRLATPAPAGADRRRLDGALLVHPALLDLAFHSRLLDGMFAGDIGHGGSQGHPAVAGLDLIEAEQQAAV